MTKNFELQWELEPIAKQTINDLFVDENLVHISTVENTEAYTVIDCEQEYFDWWIENKAESDDFINDSDYDHEDGCTSTSKTLNPDIDIWNIKDFSEFVRATSEKYWIRDNEYNLEIELNDLKHQLSKFKVINKSNVPNDVRQKINEVLLACRNIGFLN
jgi:hypothetical protein